MKRKSEYRIKWKRKGENKEEGKEKGENRRNKINENF
jgi:hypothetical protein